MAQLLWRQHRTATLFYGGLLLLWCIFVLILGNQMHAASATIQQQGCATNSDSQACFNLLVDYNSRFNHFLMAMPLILQLTPLFIGMLVGAPLIAREFEQRTNLFVWVQSVTRQRWAITTISAIMALYLLAAAILSAIFAWLVSQGYEINGNLLTQGNPYTQYDLTGIVPIGYIAFALAVGIAAGTIFRRTIVTMGIVLFSFAIMRPLIAHFRYSWVTPVTYTYLDRGGALPTWVVNGLTVGSGYVDAHGAVVSSDVVNAACGASDNYANCIQSHGWMDYLKVIPASDFWMIQGVETAFFGLLALGLLAFAVWYIVRRGE